MREANFLSRKDWAALIKEQKLSGLSPTEFCLRRNISKSSFYVWVSKLKKEAAGKTNLLRVETSSGPDPLRVVFQNGVALHFAQTPDPEWLLELMRLVS